jgi:hypothetical protein
VYRDLNKLLSWDPFWSQQTVTVRQGFQVELGNPYHDVKQKVDHPLEEVAEVLETEVGGSGGAPKAEMPDHEVEIPQ